MKTFISIISFCLILTATHTSAPAAEKAYHIGPGDVLEISVWKDPNLSRKVVVPPDGVIAFPLIEGFYLMINESPFIWFNISLRQIRIFFG